LEEPTLTTKITARPNGPYIVEGDIELVDPTGARVSTAGKAKIALCRCGGSTTKPFCDGTHSKLGFAAAEAAVTQSQDKPS
jgi:CDGSH-type Zn-finger protein